MITIKDRGYDRPLVKELLAQALTRAGMPSWQAYPLATELKDYLNARNIVEITVEDLSEIVYNRLMDINPKVAQRYKAWDEVLRGSGEPMVILLGGGTGVGTTTVGTEVAHRLGIRNVIPTDSIREVMRKMVSPKLLPVLHASTYNAKEYLTVPIANDKDKDILGYQLQVWSVMIGIEAVVDRALREGMPTIVEGIHIVPGFIAKEYLERLNVMMFMLQVKDERVHRNRFYARAQDTHFSRNVDGYMRNFDLIRKIQKYLMDQSKENKVPVFDNVDIEDTVVDVTMAILDKVIKSRGG